MLFKNRKKWKSSSQSRYIELLGTKMKLMKSIWELNNKSRFQLHKVSSRSLPRSSRNQLPKQPIIDFYAHQWCQVSMWMMARMPRAQMINYLKHRLNRIHQRRHHSLQEIQLDRPTSKHSALINLVKTINSHQQHETDLGELVDHLDKVKMMILLT